jgi:hypothetical protein
LAEHWDFQNIGIFYSKDVASVLYSLGAHANAVGRENFRIFYYNPELLLISCVKPRDVDPGSMTLWIRIGIPGPGSGSRGKKMKKNFYNGKE